MQEACKLFSVLFEHALLFLLNYLNSPQLDESFLFDFSLLLLFGLAVLLEFDLP
jgi:hypothetical protein